MDINEYIEAHSTPAPTYLDIVYRQTHQLMVNPRMLSGFTEGRLLSFLSKMLRPSAILEIGTFTGYSALCLAEGLSAEGHLHTLEKNDELESLIRHHFSLSPYEKQISLHIGEGLALLPSFQNQMFDLIFLDADKREYLAYYEACLPLLRAGGYILADNTLWDGHVIDSAYNRDKQTVSLRAFNDFVVSDSRVETLILPIRDGLTLLRKR